MLKRTVLWFIPLLILAVFAICFVVIPMASSHAATISRPVAGPTNTTPTPASSASPSIMWGGQ